MNPITFPEAEAIIAKNQPEYIPLPAHFASDQQGTTTFCWKLTWRERIAVLLGGKIWHQVWTFHQPLQPQLLLADKPELKKQGKCPYCGVLIDLELGCLCSNNP